MRSLLITQAKPNPAGKDRDRNSNDIPASQLGGEWVDFENNGDEPYNLEDIVLQHVAYPPENTTGVYREVMNFQGAGILGVGESLRVHSGAGPLSELLQEDRSGVDFHIFTGRNYVWNNYHSDTPRLKNSVTNIEIDKATYASPVPEGRILQRRANSLV